MVWDDDTINFLKQLWAEGHTTAEIGRRLGTSKNSVVGKAHRLHLDGRPSPIKRNGVATLLPAPETEIFPSPKKQGEELPPLPAEMLVPPIETPKPRPVFVAPKPPPPPLPTRRETFTCCWPIGTPGTKKFRFCGDAAEQFKPYCKEHSKLAYVKIRKREEDDPSKEFRFKW